MGDDAAEGWAGWPVRSGGFRVPLCGEDSYLGEEVMGWRPGMCL